MSIDIPKWTNIPRKKNMAQKSESERTKNESATYKFFDL